MAAPTPTVTAYFTVTGSTTVFVLDDPVRGVLDNVSYTLSGDVPVDISGYVRSVTISRGRQRALDEITAGVAQVTVNNDTRIFDPNYTAGTYYGNIRPGKRVTIAAAGITIFDGLVDDWNYTFPVSLDSTASFDVVDCLGTLGSAEFDEWTTTVSQTPGARLASILDRPEVAFPPTRALDTGTSTLQADLVSWGSNVLNYCQLVARCDLGQLFASKDGILTFYGRNRSFTGVGAPQFRDDGTGIAYSGIEIDYGTELLFNRVSIDATGFTKQTVTDATSFATFNKWWSLSLSALPLETQDQALQMANYLLNLYSEPADRFQSVTIDLPNLSVADQLTVVALDIGSVVRVVYTPNKVSTAIDKFCLIEGIDTVMSEGVVHTATFYLSNLADGFSGRPFVLDDATYGVLDTVGAGVLAF